MESSGSAIIYLLVFLFIVGANTLLARLQKKQAASSRPPQEPFEESVVKKRKDLQSVNLRETVLSAPPLPPSFSKKKEKTLTNIDQRSIPSHISAFSSSLDSRESVVSDRMQEEKVIYSSRFERPAYMRPEGKKSSHHAFFQDRQKEFRRSFLFHELLKPPLSLRDKD